MALYGIDVSSNQPPDICRKVKYDFAIVKATGNPKEFRWDYVNPYMDEQAEDAYNRTGRLGLYHFTYGLSDAVKEADFFLSKVQKWIGKAVLVIDYEGDQALNRGREWVRLFAKRIESKTGVKPIIYSSGSVIVGQRLKALGYPIWCANYYKGYVPIHGYDTTGCYIYNGCEDSAMWQFTSTGYLSGYTLPLDLNVCYADWSTLLGKGGGGSDEMDKKVAKFCERMMYWCGPKGNLGYDQLNRWDIREGGEGDCSSLTYWCLWEAGLLKKPIGNLYNHLLYTGTLRAHLKAAGWQELPPSLSLCKPGDVLLNDGAHVAVVVSGSGTTAKLAQASIDEHGNIAGGQSGDQTGNETNIRQVYSYPWNVIMRPPTSSGGVDPKPEPEEDDDLKQVNNAGGNVHRLYNKKTTKHLITIAKNEVDALKKAGWKDEGIAFKAPKGGVNAVYRLYNPKNGDHLLTTSFTEATKCQKAGWVYEGVPWFGKESGTPIYRLYKNEHLFTADKNEHDQLKKSGWKDEGIAWYF